MPPLPARLALPAAAALALLAGAAVAAPSRPPVVPATDPAQDRAALVVAQDRAARTAAAIEDLKRELTPAHLTDPMPDVDRAFGLSSLRSDYADAQRRAAGYRATLGSQHPTLVATEQLMEDLRTQLLAGTRQALASAERDAAEARAEVAATERRLAGTSAVSAPSRAVPVEARKGDTADVTGTTAPTRRAATSPLSLPPADAAPAAVAHAERAAVAAAPPSPPASHPLRNLALAAAALGLAVLCAAGAALRALRLRRPRTFPAPVRRVEPALATAPVLQPALQPAPAPEPTRAAAPDGVPVLGRLFVRTPAAPSAEAMSGLHATLRTAFGEATARMTVLVTPAADLPVSDADASAFALALAAAAAGRRPLLMEARARGRLRCALAPAGAPPAAIEAGGAVRTLYRLGSEGAAVALLPSDPGEAEAAASAAGRPGAAPLRGLDAFDTVILVGDDAAALASSADLLLLAAPAGASPAALAEAARALDGGGRPCGAVLVEPVPAPRPSALPRRRAAPEPAFSARLGLRGTLAPPQRRAG